MLHIFQKRVAQFTPTHACLINNRSHQVLSKPHEHLRLVGRYLSEVEWMRGCVVGNSVEDHHLADLLTSGPRLQCIVIRWSLLVCRLGGITLEMEGLLRYQMEELMRLQFTPHIKHYWNQK